jgi:serine/threonine protein kinase
VDYLHTRNIGHRDIKPENILLKGSQIKLIDFGLSNQYGARGRLRTPCGSPCFAPPEMISGLEYDPMKSDIWSIGITLYYMVVGNLPFDSPNLRTLYEQILSAEITVPEDIDERIVTLLRGMLAGEADDRMSTGEVLGLLHEWGFGLQDNPTRGWNDEVAKKVQAETSFDMDTIQGAVLGGYKNGISAHYHILMHFTLFTEENTKVDNSQRKQSQQNASASFLNPPSSSARSIIDNDATVIVKEGKGDSIFYGKKINEESDRKNGGLAAGKEKDGFVKKEIKDVFLTPFVLEKKEKKFGRNDNFGFQNYHQSTFLTGRRSKSPKTPETSKGKKKKKKNQEVVQNFFIKNSTVVNHLTHNTKVNPHLVLSPYLNSICGTKTSKSKSSSRSRKQKNRASPTPVHTPGYTSPGSQRMSTGPGLYQPISPKLKTIGVETGFLNKICKKSPRSQSPSSLSQKSPTLTLQSFKLSKNHHNREPSTSKKMKKDKKKSEERNPGSSKEKKRKSRLAKVNNTGLAFTKSSKLKEPKLTTKIFTPLSRHSNSKVNPLSKSSTYEMGKLKLANINNINESEYRFNESMKNKKKIKTSGVKNKLAEILKSIAKPC